MSDGRTAPRTCACVIEQDVVWGDMDAYGHVNNTVYFRYFEDVRMAHFDELGVHAVMEETGIGPILGSTKARFRSPLRYPERIRIGSTIEDVQTDRFTMRYQVTLAQSASLVCEGEALVVYFDYNNHAKAAVPDEIRRAIQVQR